LLKPKAQSFEVKLPCDSITFIGPVGFEVELNNHTTGAPFSPTLP
jgi:hypothetical protein